MAISYGFFDSQEGDRQYEAADFNRLFDGIITDGIFSSVGDAFNIVPGDGGMMVIVNTGRAWFNNSWIYNDSIYPILIPESETLLNRIDAIVIEVNKTNEVRADVIKVISGTPAYEDPEKPELIRADGVYQYALAYVTVEAGVSVIDESNIEVVIGNEETPYVSGEINYLSIENVLLEWNDAFDDYFTIWKGAKETEFRAFMTDIVNELSELEIGQIQAGILRKENLPVELTGSLMAGSTSLTLTNDAVNNNSYIEIYSDPFGAVLMNATQTGHSINLTFKPVATSTTIKVLVRNE